MSVCETRRHNPNFHWDASIDFDIDKTRTTDNVVGDFEAALQYLIDTIKAKEGQYSTTLAQFDSLRGNDWYTQTRAQQQQGE